MMKVCWEKSLSDSFCVRQGDFLSQLHIWIDSLENVADLVLVVIASHLFAGAVCYADKIVLLAPCPPLLRIFLYPT